MVLPALGPSLPLAGSRAPQVSSPRGARGASAPRGDELAWSGDAAAGGEVGFQEGDLFLPGTFSAHDAPNQHPRERNAADTLPGQSCPGVQPEAPRSW